MTPFLKMTLKMVLLVMAAILVCRVTHSFAMIVIMFMGFMFALSKQRGRALVLYLLIPFLTITNHMILPKNETFAITSRVGMVGMTGALMIAAARSPGKQQLPLSGLLLFCICAAFSSVQGWFPLISYLKLLNFVVFICGIYIGTRNLHHRPSDILLLRATFFAFALLLVFGSLATLPFPEVAYFTSLSGAIREGGTAYAVETFQAREGGGLFSGITVHSQFLAPMLSCTAGWVICDMLLIEQRGAKLHLLMLAVIPVMLFMTRSRAGLLSFVVMLGMVNFYCLPKIAVSSRLRGQITSLMVLLVGVLVIAAVGMELKGDILSRWLRKTDDLVMDDRSWGEALTKSRQSLLDVSLHEFRRSPFLGSGFQVSEDHRGQYASGLISLYTAPIEKGLLPTMILGETGLLGSAAFIFFLILFFTRCSAKKYTATITMFVVYLSTNMAESTFFSPSGGGGIMWMITVVGGFLIDMMVFLEQKRKGTLPFRVEADGRVLNA